MSALVSSDTQKRTNVVIMSSALGVYLLRSYYLGNLGWDLALGLASSFRYTFCGSVCKTGSGGKSYTSSKRHLIRARDSAETEIGGRDTGGRAETVAS